MKKLTDDSYLSEIISASKIFVDATPHCIFGVKNLNSEHIYVSPYLLQQIADQLSLINHKKLLKAQLIVFLANNFI